MSGEGAGSRPVCDQYTDELAELALGILTGRERVQTLAHVEACPSCRAEVEQLSLAADALLEVVPGVEPPLGFEVRLRERLGSGRAARRLVSRQRRLRQVSLVLACVLLLVAVGLGAGWLARGGEQPTTLRSAFGTQPGGRVETASLLAGGRTLGTVVVYSGRTSWLFMSLEDGSWSGKATCEVRLADGATVPLGTFWLDEGYGAWGVTLPSRTGSIQTASVVSDGSVLASAHFPSIATSADDGAGGQAEPWTAH